MDRPAAVERERRDSIVGFDIETFRAIGHELVDQIAGFLETLPQRPVTAHTSRAELLALLERIAPPEQGGDPAVLLRESAELLFDHSLFIGHPAFMGYITAAPNHIGILSDFLAAAVNPNVGGWPLSPLATEIELQAVRWLALFLGYPEDCGGLFTSGGNVANFTAVLAARRAKLDWDVRTGGLRVGPQQVVLYASQETHTWVQKAADMFGFGTDAIRWIPAAGQRMDVSALVDAVEADRAAGFIPLMVVATAGTVSTGAVDPLPEIAAFCRANDLWFHVDGAYGAPAASLPEAGAALKAIREADSIAFDPHKWLYAPLEAGCVLVREPQHLFDAFSYRPSYYHLTGDETVNLYEYGIQNSRGFRAFKVWMALRQIGFEGYRNSIRQDIALARRLFEHAEAHPELQPFTNALSITTFRYVPPEIDPATADARERLNALNQELLDTLEASGKAFISNAVIDGHFLLRACVVNFNTTAADIDALVELVVELGRRVEY